MTSIPDWTPTVMRDFVNMLCGEFIGSGMSREVWSLVTDPTKVVKVEPNAGYFQNICEWETWQTLEHKPQGKFLAPCYHISPCGIVLIQARVDPLPRNRRVTKLPDFLSDFKASNYGIFKGRVVCADYGTNLLMERGAERSRMRKPQEFFTK